MSLAEIKSFLARKIGRQGFIKILEAFIITSIIIGIHLLFFPDYLKLAALPLSVSLMSINPSYEKSFKMAIGILKMYALGSIIAICLGFLLPNGLLAYLISILITSIIVYFKANGAFAPMPLIVINIMYFCILPNKQAPQIMLDLAPIPLFFEAALGAALAIAIAYLAGLVMDQKTLNDQPIHPKPLKIIPTAQSLTPSADLNNQRTTELRNKSFSMVLSEIDPRFYMVIASAAISCLVYIALKHFFDFEYPLFIFNSIIVVAQPTYSATVSAGIKRISGTILGASIGLISFLALHNLPFYIFLIPLVIIFAIFADYIVFGDYFNVTVIIVFMLLIDSSHGQSIDYVLIRFLCTCIAVLISVLVYRCIYSRNKKE